MVHEAMIVETALPTTSSDTGKVARAGFAARLRPRMPPAVTTANQPVTPTACANRQDRQIAAEELGTDGRALLIAKAHTSRLLKNSGRLTISGS